ncbi:MAG: DUF2330 domain-containing protein, partial [Myxococcales bacterium]|nr:DUF2330 domain-containing protein [Myxococcales bacterium]
LVEYWEQDPCSGGYGYGERKYMVDGMTVMNPAFGATAAELRVTVEAQFAVGEYEIVILSAEDSLGLDTWLRERGYNIPAGAAAALRPYIHKGMKFFVAKVDVKKVKRDAAGRVTLSPLRFHYDSPTFSLPVRLGLLNSSGAQELIIHILSRAVRYQVANYKNVAAPTNVDVTDATRDDFARFYAALFDRVVREDPGAVVTEYAWDASTCDPCPVEPLDVGELATLGLDVLPSYRRWFARPHEASEAEAVAAQLVLTRLHARYSAASLGEDLVFQAATPIVGGRETFADDGVTIERGARPDPSGSNNFQTRFVIRHRWTGAITCPEPRRGRWGGPPGGGAPPATQASAGELAVTERDAPLERYLVDAARSTHAPLLRKDRVPAPEPIRGCRVSDSGLAGLAGFALVGLVALGRRRTRRA